MKKNLAFRSYAYSSMLVLYHFVEYEVKYNLLSPTWYYIVSFMYKSFRTYARTQTNKRVHPMINNDKI